MGQKETSCSYRYRSFSLGGWMQRAGLELKRFPVIPACFCPTASLSGGRMYPGFHKLSGSEIPSSTGKPGTVAAKILPRPTTHFHHSWPTVKNLFFPDKLRLNSRWTKIYRIETKIPQADSVRSAVFTGCRSSRLTLSGNRALSGDC